MRFRLIAGVCLAAIATVVLGASPAQAESCRNDDRLTVIVTLPGITWSDIRRFEPPAILEAAERGAAGSMVVRTIASRTSYASGFATIGAGARVDGGKTSGGPAYPYVEPTRDYWADGSIDVGGLDEIRTFLDDSGYSTVVPGALAKAVRPSGRGVASVGNSDTGLPPASPIGYGRWGLLASMDDKGIASVTATDARILERDPDAFYGVRSNPDIMNNFVEESLRSCLISIIDPGDLTRVDEASMQSGHELVDERRAALAAADDLVADVAQRVDATNDLLLIVSPTSPWWDRTTHFGVAIAQGPGFSPGSQLTSASTHRDGMVTLPDVAPTVLRFLGIDAPASMLGRPFNTTAFAGDRIAAAIAIDRESTFIDAVRTPVSTGFVVFQLLVYALTVWLLLRRERAGLGAVDERVERILGTTALLLAAFPLAAYLAGVINGHGFGPWGYAGLLIVLDVAIVLGLNFAVSAPLDRLLGVTSLTLVLLIADLMLGAPLQLNTVFSYSPIVAGRFSGIGNIGFAVLGATAVLTGALIVHRWGRGRATLTIVAVLFVLTVIADGAPQFGSDVGGALALVPGLAITWLLLSGRKLSLQMVLFGLGGAVVVVALFLIVDLSRPAAQQTHLARLYNDIRADGMRVFSDTVSRKARTNLRVFRSTIWTFVVPAALALCAWLLLWPRDRWETLGRRFPSIQAGLIGGLVLALLGFAVNDSGIVIPAMMFAYLVPVALLAHLSLRHSE